MKLCYRVFKINLILLTVCVSMSLAQNLLHQPESVVYDSRNDRYLVSNYETGDIVAIDNQGNQSYFDTTLTRIAGLMTCRDTLFVASNLEPYIGLVAYSLITDMQLFYLPIASEGLLNDLDYDNQGNIYISDYWDSKIFKVDMSTLSCSLFNETISDPNGVLCDTLRNRLLVLSVGAPGNPIKAIDLNDGTVSTVINTGVHSLDGMTRDSEHNVYISSWWSNSCYRYDSSFTNPRETVSSDHNGPADIYFDQHNNLLCVPNFYDNTVEFIDILSAYSPETIIPVDYNIPFAYPNPFNARTTIEYSLTKPSEVTIDIYDVLGNKVVSLINSEVISAGNHKVSWNADNYASGIYYYKLRTDNAVETGRMTLLK